MDTETGQSNWTLYSYCACGAFPGKPCVVIGTEAPRLTAHVGRPLTDAEKALRGLSGDSEGANA